MTAASQPFVGVGRVIDEIPVEISYRIIELLSAGLYSSPNKAIEELVSNSYDAMAGKVDLFLSNNLDAVDATIWAIDDGESMDLPGLFDLWRVASSSKRESPNPKRPPIGKFGIGKLATYVLARQLTYICRRGEETLAVTMGFASIDPEQDAATRVRLDVRRLSDDDLVTALAPLRRQEGGQALAQVLLGPAAPRSWTAVAMSDLRPPAQHLKLGRLRWILSTALPMSPGFGLRVNGKAVEPSIERSQVLKAWRVGENNELSDGLGVSGGRDDIGPYVEIDGISARIRGDVKLYADVLTKGRAAEIGRSHGFFVMVRGRLINLDDALFGMPAPSHATFNRFYMIVHADGLDGFLASAREAVVDSPAVERFRMWLRAEFNEARKFYDTWVAAQEEAERLSTRIGNTPSSLSRRPLVQAIFAVLDGALDGLSLTEVPRGL